MLYLLGCGILSKYKCKISGATTEISQNWCQLAFGIPKSIAAALMNQTDIKDAVHDIICANLTIEISGLGTKCNPSILRKTTKEDLIEFSWNNLYQEFSSRTPRYLQMFTTCVCNPSQPRNVHKKSPWFLPCVILEHSLFLFSTKTWVLPDRLILSYWGKRG